MVYEYYNFKLRHSPTRFCLEGINPRDGIYYLQLNEIADTERCRQLDLIPSVNPDRNRYRWYYEWRVEYIRFDYKELRFDAALRHACASRIIESG